MKNNRTKNLPPENKVNTTPLALQQYKSNLAYANRSYNKETDTGNNGERGSNTGSLEILITKCNHRKESGLQVFKKDSEQIQNRNARVANCGKGFIAVENKITRRSRVTHINCGSLSCPSCRAKKQKKVIAQAMNFARVYPSAKLLTLTLTTSIFSNDKLSRSCESARYINEAWKRFRALMWKHKLRFKFFRMIEFTKNGTAHIHCMVSRALPKDVVKGLWYISSDKSSWHVHVGRTNKDKSILRGGAAASYLVKYVTKMELDNIDALYITQTRLTSYSKNMTLGQFSRLSLHHILAFSSDEKELQRVCDEFNIRAMIHELRCKPFASYIEPPF